MNAVFPGRLASTLAGEGRARKRYRTSAIPQRLLGSGNGVAAASLFFGGRLSPEDQLIQLHRLFRLGRPLLLIAGPPEGGRERPEEERRETFGGLD